MIYELQKSVHFNDTIRKGIEMIEFKALNCIFSINKIVVCIKTLILRAYGTLKSIIFTSA